MTHDPVETKMLDLLDDPNYKWDFWVDLKGTTELYRVHRLLNGKRITVFIATLNKKGEIIDDCREVVIEE